MHEAIKDIPDFFHALKSQKKKSFFRCNLYLKPNSQNVNKYDIRLYLGSIIGKSKAFTDESLQRVLKTNML